MTVAIFLDAPDRTTRRYAPAREIPDADLTMQTLIVVVPPVALPLVAEAADEEPTWEDAEWQ